ncbi:TetR/AcrR family transcriptional regulator [Bacillus testis]|uniref:TetR/AcrR family transcriptional regulator n=1 Tax=Bacillus testis TaxID=1622072 RepID=UPI00067F7074|nr:TetR/AcrR family transcriptional regulator [Bacillus testis]
MKEKEKLIMDAAMKLFAQKGFSATSIQEIATEAEISKGSFYLYYKSKENLLYRIFMHHYKTFHQEILNLKSRHLSPRELFIEQMVTQYRGFLDSKDFLVMYARESAIPFNKEIGELIGKIRSDVTYTLKDALNDIYGGQVGENIWSFTLLVQSLSQSYLELLIHNTQKMDLYELARFILKRSDSLAAGFEKGNESIVIREEDILPLFKCPFQTEEYQQLRIVQEAIQSAKATYSEQKDTLITLEVLEEEVNRPDPRGPVIQGMAANLQKDGAALELQSLLKDLYRL